METKKIRDILEENERIQQKILKIFGVTRYDRLYLVRDGVVDTTKEFRIVGWMYQGSGIELFLTGDLEKERVTVTSKEQFERIKKRKSNMRIQR